MFFVAKIRRNLLYSLKCICQTWLRLEVASSALQKIDIQGSYQGSHQCLLGCAVSGDFYPLLSLPSKAQPPVGIPWASTKIFPAMVASSQVWVLGNVRFRSSSVPGRYFWVQKSLHSLQPSWGMRPHLWAWLCFGCGVVGRVQVTQEDTGLCWTLHSPWFLALVTAHWRKYDHLKSHKSLLAMWESMFSIYFSTFTHNW